MLCIPLELDKVAGTVSSMQIELDFSTFLAA
jgi:hypothetical protein